jgi:hypothetical protein
VVIAIAFTALGCLTATGSSAYAAARHAVPAPVRPISAPGFKFVRTAEAGGTYALQNGATGLCLDDSTPYGLRGFACNLSSYDNGYQAWPAPRQHDDHES